MPKHRGGDLACSGKQHPSQPRNTEPRNTEHDPLQQGGTEPEESPRTSTVDDLLSVREVQPYAQEVL